MIDLVKDRYPDPTALSTDAEEAVRLNAIKIWHQAWNALFGSGSVIIFSPDQELNARVYTLDGKNGYRIEHKIVRGLAHFFSGEELTAQHVRFPQKARCGEKHGRSKLAQEDILLIRAWARDVLDKGQVPCWTSKAADFGVSEGTLRDIVKRRTWTHVADV